MYERMNLSGALFSVLYFPCFTCVNKIDYRISLKDSDDHNATYASTEVPKVSHRYSKAAEIRFHPSHPLVELKQILL